MPRTRGRAAKRGSLTVVGVGINGAPQTTPEAIFCMKRAERLFYLVTNPTTELWIRELNPAATSLRELYVNGKPRTDTYAEMTNQIVSEVRNGLDVCAAFYGHPGVLVHATQWAIRRVRRAGHRARMLPGVSAEGCLYADLGLNPGDHGVQSFEATDFLMSRRRFDPTSELILWQIGVIGELVTRDATLPHRRDRMQTLADRLLKSYPASHRVVLYEAPTFPGADPMIKRVPLQRLSRARIRPTTTMYVPALPQRPWDTKILRWFDED
jgi:precorrin-6B methylase 1